MTNVDLSYDHDLNFEWIASYVISQYQNEFSIDQLNIQPIGIFGRHVNHDVASIKIVEKKLKNYLEFKLNRDGIYDNLPQGLFHRPLSTKTFSDSIDDTRSKIKVESRNETAARDYFHVFEQELLISNLIVQSLVLDIENRDFGFANEQLSELLAFDLQPFSKLEEHKILELLSYKSLSNYNLHEKLSLFLNYIFQLHIQIHLSCRFADEQVSDPQNILGIHSLDWNLCLGDHIERFQHRAVIKVFELPTNQSIENMNNKVIQLLNWLLPCYYKFEINYESRNFIIESLAGDTAVLN